MTRLLVASAGPATSVQDEGRYGAQRYGLTPGGAMDRLSAAAANCLVGNATTTALIEIGPLGAGFTARDGAVRIGLAGAPREAAIGERRVAINNSVTIRDGETLSIGIARAGAFSYLAVERGIIGEATFGSLAVNARAGLGSPYPRPLQAGDELEVAAASGAPEQQIALPVRGDGPIGIVLGPQDDEFDDVMIRLFLDSEWTVSATSDRMGYRLEGPAIRHRHGHNIVSDGTVLGSIQIPGNGAPIVLMSDRGTSGGYPKIAAVTTADIGRLAQLPPGSRFRFKVVAMNDAQAAVRAFAELIRGLPHRVQAARDVVVDLDELQRANVAGAAVSAVDSVTWHAAAGHGQDGDPSRA